MRMSRADYLQYLRSPHWNVTRVRKLNAAGWRCEWCPIAFEHPKHGAIRDGDLRCTETVRLEVHHKHYGSVGAERDEDLMVLCKFHHMVEHVQNSECGICSEATVTDEDYALDLVRETVAMYGGDIDAVSLEDVDVPGLCDYHEHVLTKDD